MDKEELITLAGDAGWTVIGHRWLRFTKGDTRIEVWYAGERPRMVSAALHSPTGGTRRINIVRDRATSIADTVRSWLSPSMSAVDRFWLRPIATPEIGSNGQVAGNVALFA
ncbi:hypothetical protein [Williamsia phyllosphaerae]|uniref:Uncharacterized protein n=1 Tax=Williamsia phyllosphaerae TaxID=885042 RepID=A0ABQ1V2J8_9NOCA|nr:hypothetical protein [Williamsia phyllosphaerae]GGF34518.1 hypothetical protein GCM10007298_32890 [Williamsia phyllosphaerae]